MTSSLIGLGLSDNLSSKSQNSVLQVIWPLSCWAKYCSTTRIPSLSIMDCHPWPTGGLIGGGVTPLQRYNQHILQLQSTGWRYKDILLYELVKPVKLLQAKVSLFYCKQHGFKSLKIRASTNFYLISIICKQLYGF